VNEPARDAATLADLAAESATDGAPSDAPTLFGCRMLRVCLASCAQGDAACQNDCVSAATARALSLLTQAVIICPATMFCGPGHPNDAGVVPCSAQDLDPGNTMPFTASCQACYDALQASEVQTACAADFLACMNDTP
jgi:hypothetical protein